MKRTLIAAALALAGLVSARCADSTAIVTNSPGRNDLADNYAHRFGAGIILGEPTGASVKYFFNDTLAIDGAAGASFNHQADNDESFYVHSDILWHKFDLIKVSKGKLPVYIGVGGLVRFRDDADNEVGVRVPVGLSYMFEDVPLDIFAELAPALDLAPSVRGEITGGIGI